MLQWRRRGENGVRSMKANEEVCIMNNEIIIIYLKNIIETMKIDETNGVQRRLRYQIFVFFYHYRFLFSLGFVLGFV